MTETQPPDRRDRQRIAYVAFRDGFGDDLLGAARAAESVRPPRVRTRQAARVAMALSGVAIAILAFVAVPRPGGGEGSVLGTPDAAAAVVGRLRATLDRGVLVREAETTTYNSGDPERFEIHDWTDLATRDQRVRTKRAGADSEYWNRGAHERWFSDPTWKDDQGRTIIRYSSDPSTGNASASASPVEEVARLVRLAKQGELTLKAGGDEQTIERTERCYAAPDLTYMECPENGAGWPNRAPKRTEPVRALSTWTLSREPQPRVLRYQYAVVGVGSPERRVAVHTRYRVWRVLPPTADHLRLVAPPVSSPTQRIVKQKVKPPAR